MNLLLTYWPVASTRCSSAPRVQASAPHGQALVPLTGEGHRPDGLCDCRGRPYHLHAQLAPSPQSMGSSFVFASWASQLRRAFARQKATSPSCARPKQQPHAFLASFRRPRLLPRRTRKCARPCRERYLRFKKRPFGRFDGISSRKVVDKSYDKSWSRAPLLSVDFVRNFAEHELPRSSRRGR